jgi:hypothetical protein
VSIELDLGAKNCSRIKIEALLALNQR